MRPAEDSDAWSVRLASDMHRALLAPEEAMHLLERLWYFTKPETALRSSPQWLAYESASYRARRDHGPPRQCSMRRLSGRKPWRTPQSTAWVRLSTSILR